MKNKLDFLGYLKKFQFRVNYTNQPRQNWMQDCKIPENNQKTCLKPKVIHKEISDTTIIQIKFDLI